MLCGDDWAWKISSLCDSNECNFYFKLRKYHSATYLSADPVAKMNYEYGLKLKQFTSVICASTVQLLRSHNRHSLAHNNQIVDVLFVLFTLLIVDSSEYFTKCSCPYLAKCSRNRSKDVSVRRNQMTKKKTRKKPTKNTKQAKGKEMKI